MKKPYWTPARYGEARCVHGVGHPIKGGVHGCCHEGCCSREDFPTELVGRPVTLVDVLLAQMANDAQRDGAY